ncbi:pyrimidine 5'-nucleotidase [Pyronema domesticum]|uniref:Similar to Uncharacterized protein C24B11.05 acc. no. Q09893 n=1 Tax=Pyronema omphalodes (strain CBS 100304) TaxID=1076935 RepID=U4KV15_PYROM|nr:pyrimidine 5'-nucleotidase [Pyronema domesticum]CCX05303.1 Similar to Uncharacterized protein C24B11.05; acc. no. Q09893 [Pyronema omphalodes CBS 100304]
MSEAATQTNGTTNGNTNGAVDERPVFFFDIDNCLYSRSSNIHLHMIRLIRSYFQTHMKIPTDEAERLHQTYYRQYGLAIEGLVRHHQVDAMEFNSKVDDALPLEECLSENKELRGLIEELRNKGKCRLWLFTNAYKTHGNRVIKLLGLEGLFEGITFCDYEHSPLVCKPKKEAFERAMSDAGISDKSKCYFIDDSLLNCQAAVDFGWGKVIHKLEPEDPLPTNPATEYHCRDLMELREMCKELF